MVIPVVVSTMPGSDGSRTDGGQLVAIRISSVEDAVYDADHQFRDCTGTLFPGKRMFHCLWSSSGGFRSLGVLG